VSIRKSGSFGGEWSGAKLDALRRYLGAYTTALNMYVEPSDVGTFGFRVASVPEPSSLVLMLLAGGVVVTRRKR